MRRRLACIMLGVALVSSQFIGCGDDVTDGTMSKTSEESTKGGENGDLQMSDESTSENIMDKEEIYTVLHNPQEEYIEEGEWKYYVSGDFLMRSKIDDSYTQKIVDGDGNSFSDIHIIGEWIYYEGKSSSAKECQSAIYRVKKDATTEPEEIFIHGGKWDDVDWIRSISSDGRHLYYSAREGLVKMNLDGTERNIIFYSNKVGDIKEIRNGYIYYSEFYIDPSPNPKMFRVNIDGTENKELNNYGKWIDGKMYFVEDNKLHMADTDNDTVEVLYESNYEELNLCSISDKYICCYEKVDDENGVLFYLDRSTLNRCVIMEFPTKIDGESEKFKFYSFDNIAGTKIEFWVGECESDGRTYYKCKCTYSVDMKKIIDIYGMEVPIYR